MPRRTKLEAEKTRGAILKAAERVFYERGVVSTSLEAVAKAAGVTRGAVYWHFKNKAELLKALADMTYLPHEALLDSLIVQKPEDPLDALCAQCVFALDVSINDPQRRRLLTILVRRCEYVEETQALINRNNLCRERMRERLTFLFEEARAKGALAAVWTPITAALALQNMVIGFVYNEMDYARPSRARNKARAEAVQAFFGALKA